MSISEEKTIPWSWLIRRNNEISTSYASMNYVSLGDSIAAGHTIDSDWATDYGEGSQYGKNGNTQTAIVPDCYTDLIRLKLIADYGVYSSATSFARSGDTVEDLIEKLDHEVVRDAIANANLVTVCIGANDVLEPAMSNLGEYINTGSVSTIEAIVNDNLAILRDDNNAYSFKALFDKLTSINSKATYVFTTIYNPYKYLWLDEGQNGFFKPVLDTIPQMTMLGFEVDELIKNGLLSTSAIKKLFDRVNGLSAHAEKFLLQLNAVLSEKIAAYQSTNHKFKLADTKAVYDPVPDRPISAPKHYNDLVNVEYTRGYDTAQMDWGRLWEPDGGAYNYWVALIDKYLSSSGLNLAGLADELVADVIERVIVLDIDPHPERYGHHALYCAFADALGWESLPKRTITYNANGGTGSMATRTVVALDNLTAYTNIDANAFGSSAEGYYFAGWNTAAGGGGTEYSNGQLIGLSLDVVLYAQWSNMFTLTFKHSQGDVIQGGSGETGPMECYALWIDGAEQGDLGAFSNSPRTYRLPYGTPIGVIAQVDNGDDRSYVTYNGTKVAGNSSDARYTFTLTGNTTVNFEWNQWMDGLSLQSYWNCYITTQ